jgi:YVTN family beta-propeller protein
MRSDVKKTIALAGGLLLTCGAAAYASLAATRGHVLPTEWRLSPPSGPVTATKTLPQSAVLTADRKHLIVVEAGAGSPGIRILDARTLDVERDIAVKDVYGVPLPDLSGDGFWVGTASQNTLAHFSAAGGTVDRPDIPLPPQFWPASIARSPDRRTLAVSGDLADAVVFVDETAGKAGAPAAVGRHPAGLAFSRDGRSLFVANWGGSTLSRIDVATGTRGDDIPVGRHPEALLLARDGKRLFVTEPDDDALGIVDVRSGRRIADLNVAPYGAALAGASPSALAASADGKRLWIVCAAADAVVAVDTSGAQPHVAGAVATGWYPTAVALDADGRSLDVVDGKGESSHANPQFDPFAYVRGAANRDSSGYDAASSVGSVRRVAIPSGAALARGLDDVRANVPPAATAPADTVVRSGGPLRHVIYVIKENRTYDQVLGDLPGADGDPALALFGGDVTPNEHALARRFGILDNTFADAKVSADGHNWSTAAFANDYLERMWPPNYGGRRSLYDFEDGADASVPRTGFLWNDALAHGITIRNYGEFTTESTGTRVPVTSHMPGLDRVTDAQFVGFDLTVSDLAREAEWAHEFEADAANGTLPQLEIVRLPNDHTAGTRPGALVPAAYVAQNDAALGKMIDELSHSRYWNDTAVFVVEDDAQNGPDHVDDQRMPAFVISAYAAGGVVHAHYSTAGVVRTIELILGLPPMTVYDARALPLYAAFATKPDTSPYAALPARVPLDETNKNTAYRAADSARADFSREDAVPNAELNDILWHAVRGSDAPPGEGRSGERRATLAGRDIEDE